MTTRRGETHFELINQCNNDKHEKIIELKELVSSSKMTGKSLKRKLNQSRMLFTKLSPEHLGQITASKFKYNRSSVKGK